MPEEAPPSSPRARATELYLQHSEELLAFFRSALPITKSDAKDLLHQTFLGLLEWLSADPSRTITSARGLLYTIARHRLHAYREARQRTPSTPTAVDPTAIEPTPGALEDDLEYLASLQEDRQGLLRAMRRLGPASAEYPVSDLQLAVYLRFWAGMTETEVGEILEHPRATIATQLRRARAELRAALAELERREPGAGATSTTLLERWWQQMQDRVGEVADTETDQASSPPHAASSRGS